ncbi:MAG TPA: hypothetical protein VGF49_16600, partial [Candidatus Solibacter sp.]
SGNSRAKSLREMLMAASLWMGLKGEGSTGTPVVLSGVLYLKGEAVEATPYRHRFAQRYSREDVELPVASLRGEFPG